MAGGEGTSRWTDDRLDDRMAGFDRTLQRLDGDLKRLADRTDEDFRAFAPLVQDIDVLQSESKAMQAALTEWKQETRAMREACQGAQAAANKALEAAEKATVAVTAAVDAGKDAREATEKARRDTMLAIAGFAAPVTVAIITGIVALITGGG